jgi:hypothetical protein
MNCKTLYLSLQTVERKSEKSDTHRCRTFHEALLAFFSFIIHSIHTRRRGRPRYLKSFPSASSLWPSLKHHSGCCMLEISKRVVFGVVELIPLALISTSLLERLNGTLHLHVSAMHITISYLQKIDPNLALKPHRKQI